MLCQIFLPNIYDNFVFKKFMKVVSIVHLLLGYVSRSLVSKFDQKSPKGSVPNGQS